MPYRREAEIVLALWRDIERELAAALPGSPEAHAFQGDAARLRDEYQRLIAAAIEHDRPVPPPMPDGVTGLPHDAGSRQVYVTYTALQDGGCPAGR
jgi:hypothetical protein